MTPMSREELVGLGLTDAGLVDLYRETFGVDLRFDGRDTLDAMARRRMAFDQVTTRMLASPSTSARGPRIGRFADDNPAAHIRASRRPAAQR